MKCTFISENNQKTRLLGWFYKFFNTSLTQFWQQTTKRERDNRNEKKHADFIVSCGHGIGHCVWR